MLTKVALIIILGAEYEGGPTVQTFDTIAECNAVARVTVEALDLSEPGSWLSNDVIKCVPYTFDPAKQ